LSERFFAWIQWQRRNPRPPGIRDVKMLGSMKRRQLRRKIAPRRANRSKLS
jgi:hypothetical protein